MKIGTILKPGIEADDLNRIIKEDFEMTIDIEKLIKKIDTDGSGEIEFEEFKALLYSEVEDIEA